MSSRALQPDSRLERPQPWARSRRDQSWRRQPEHRPTVNAYERDRYRQQQAGTWAPFTPTGPVRDHIDQLRKDGMTSEQIARASGVSVSTLTRLFKVTRLTATAAEAILAVRPPEQRAAAIDSARQLRALVADGWTVEQLAAAAGLSDRTIGQAIHRNTTPSPRTTAAIGHLYEALRLEDPGDDTAAVRPACAPNATAGRPPPARAVSLHSSWSTRWRSTGPSMVTRYHCSPQSSRQPYDASPASTPTTRSAAASASPPGLSSAAAPAKAYPPTRRCRRSTHRLGNEAEASETWPLRRFDGERLAYNRRSPALLRPARSGCSLVGSARPRELLPDAYERGQQRPVMPRVGCSATPIAAS